MSSIEEINEIDLLNNLRNRYKEKNIFTSVGPTLLIMNPFENIPDLYGEYVLDEFIKEKYFGYSFDERID